MLRESCVCAPVPVLVAEYVYVQGKETESKREGRIFCLCRLDGERRSNRRRICPCVRACWIVCFVLCLSHPFLQYLHFTPVESAHVWKHTPEGLHVSGSAQGRTCRMAHTLELRMLTFSFGQARRPFTRRLLRARSATDALQ